MNLKERFENYVAQEPAMFVERLRILLYAIPVLVGWQIDDLRIAAILAIASVAVSTWAQFKIVREKVTPFWKVEHGHYDEYVNDLIEEYPELENESS